jgi:hypothetical protein
MIDSPSIALAFAAGLISFVSPCCLSLVPGYLATVSGMGVQDVGRRVDARVLARSLLFVATFSAVFVAPGLAATTLGAFLFDSQPVLNTVAGAAIVVLGALLMATAFVTRLNREWLPPGLIERAGRGGPVVAGAAFAIAGRHASARRWRRSSAQPPRRRARGRAPRCWPSTPPGWARPFCCRPSVSAPPHGRVASSSATGRLCRPGRARC